MKERARAGGGPAELERDVRACIERSGEALAAFLALPEATPAREQLAAFDRIDHPLDEVSGRVALLSSVHPERRLRDTAERMEQELIAWGTELSLHRPSWERLARIDPAELGDPEDLRFLEHSLRDFRRSGVDRDEATRARIRQLQDELVEVGQAFDRNIVEGGRSLRIEEGHAGLDGLPRDFLESHPEADDGSVTLTTDPTDFMPFRLYAHRADLRARLSFEYHNRAWPENLPVLDQLLALRRELAAILGYPNWAEYATEDKMVASAAAARAFIERVAALARARAEREVAELLEEKRRLEPGATAILDHDVGYLVERVKRARFDFDSQEVRSYFPFERVRDGVLRTSATLYGVEIVRDPGAQVWHPSVEAYELRDGGRTVARFFLDLFPREGKNKHAFVCELAGAREGVIPEAALVTNFPEPGPGRPALLLHSQVTTLFHEIGHLLHHLFATRTRYLRFAGISNEWDFVEVPSQLYEEWAWDPDVLRGFAQHHESGEPIPRELVDRMRAAEEYGKGLTVATQSYYAMLSLSYHERTADADGAGGLDTTEQMRRLRRGMVPVEPADGTHFQAAFGHLHGYSALYYTYLWSHVIAKDLYGAFAGDPMDRAGRGTPARFRSTILAPGGSRDARELVEAFLGRGYELEAWEAWLER